MAALAGALTLAAAPAVPAPPGGAPARPSPPPARPAPPRPAMAEPQYLFDIATAAGGGGSTWAALAYDRKHDELFAIYDGLVHVFSASAMESYAFGGDGDLGNVERVALLESGEMLLLTSTEARRAVVRCNFRGERLGGFEVKPPEGFEGFAPDRIQVEGQKVYLVQTAAMRVLVTDLAGQVEKAYDLATMVLARTPDLKLGMSGFWADARGNLAFTMPFAFTAFVLDPSHRLRQFGTRGSSPGKFNIAGAIAIDESGYLFVLDRLRAVVMVFDPALRFLVEFGYRGEGPSNLIAPYDLAVGNGKVFVSQARDRGVKVYRYELPASPAPPAAAAGGAGSG